LRVRFLVQLTRQVDASFEPDVHGPKRSARQRCRSGVTSARRRYRTGLPVTLQILRDTHQSQ
jgi:hypothetical protein